MGDVKKSVWSAAAVVVGALMVAGGTVVRDRVDTGRPAASTLALDNLIVSKDQGPEVPEGAYFREMVELLKREYVEPISDEGKLAAGAVRGMVQSLADPECLFYDAKEYRAFQSARAGRYEGIGVDLVLVDDAMVGTKGSSDPMGGMRIPRLVVGAVVPGGPADAAGVKPGDWVESVDGHWVLNARDIGAFREAQRKFVGGSIKEEIFRPMQKAIRDKTDHSILPLKAREKLTVGSTGSVKVVWNRGAGKRETAIKRAASTVKALGTGATMVLRFIPGADQALKSAIQGRTEVVLDLRGNAFGDVDVMRKCLEVVAKKGSYGVLAGRDGKAVDPLTVQVGNPAPPKLKILVDATTRDTAEIFALALSSTGAATLSGGKTAGDPHVVEAVSLPGGEGYTLVTATYKRSDPTGGAK